MRAGLRESSNLRSLRRRLLRWHHGCVSGDLARALYELRVVDAGPSDRFDALLKSILGSVLDRGMFGIPHVFPEKVEVQIVDRRTDEILWSRRTDFDVARLFAVDIDRDLDRLGPGAFAAEWGIAATS